MDNLKGVGPSECAFRARHGGDYNISGGTMGFWQADRGAYVAKGIVFYRLAPWFFLSPQRWGYPGETQQNVDVQMWVWWSCDVVSWCSVDLPITRLVECMFVHLSHAIHNIRSTNHKAECHVGEATHEIVCTGVLELPTTANHRPQHRGTSPALITHFSPEMADKYGGCDWNLMELGRLFENKRKLVF